MLLKRTHLNTTETGSVKRLLIQADLTQDIQLILHQRPELFVNSATSNEIMNIHRISLPNSMGPILSLNQNSWIPKEFSEHHKISCG